LVLQNPGPLEGFQQITWTAYLTVQVAEKWGEMSMKSRTVIMNYAVFPVVMLLVLPSNPTIVFRTMFLEEDRLRVFENRVLRRIFRPKRDEVTGGCRKLHNEELHNLYSSRSIIRIIKSRRMRWVGHVARMGRREMHIVYWWKCQKERNHWEDQDIGGWTIFKWILER
jgi:hypothetical protein